MKPTREKPPTPEQEAEWKARRLTTDKCEDCKGTGWFFINEHWTYPAGSRDNRQRQTKRELHDRAQIGKRWTDTERGEDHEIREAVIPCQCRSAQ